MEPTATHHPDEDALADLALGRVTDPARLTDLERHLAGCPDCRQRVSRVAGPPTASGVSAPPLPPEPDPDLQIDPDLFADYRLLRSLGRGGMGEVFLARNQRLDRHEAIKIIHPGYVTHPGAVERFQREVRNAAQYQDQHIVTVYGYLQAGATVGFAMEHVPGQTLADVVKAKGPLPVPLACHYARQVALGLQRAHEKGMVHRDIKPGNLILRKDGARHLVKILDFGLSKVTAEVPADGELTGAGRAMGTPAYAAPEQALDAAAADTRSDIYSLGGTLFFLLTGRAPFAGTSAIDLWRAHVETPPPSVTELLPDVPAELAAIIGRMLAKSPAERYQMPAEVAAVLVPFIKAGEGGGGPAAIAAAGAAGRDAIDHRAADPDDGDRRPAPRATAELPPLPARRPPWGLIGGVGPRAWWCWRRRRRPVGGGRLQARAPTTGRGARPTPGPPRGGIRTGGRRAGAGRVRAAVQRGGHGGVGAHEQVGPVDGPGRNALRGGGRAGPGGRRWRRRGTRLTTSSWRCGRRTRTTRSRRCTCGSRRWPAGCEGTGSRWAGWRGRGRNR